jgi:hypothetical protein
MAFAATVTSEDVRREMETRSARIFWQTITQAVGKPLVDRPEWE